MSQHHHLYNSHSWRKRRLAQLSAEPLCRMCLARGRTVAATVADHIEPHRGDVAKFDGLLQSLCRPCHGGAKAELEQSGTLRGCDVNGQPLDPNHHWRA